MYPWGFCINGNACLLYYILNTVGNMHTKDEKEDYGRKRLQARMAGNIASGLMSSADLTSGLDLEDSLRKVAKVCNQLAGYLLEEAGL